MHTIENIERDVINEVVLSRTASQVVTQDIDGNTFHDVPVTPRDIAWDLHMFNAKARAKKMRRIARSTFKNHVKYARWHFSHAEAEHIADEVQ